MSNGTPGCPQVFHCVMKERGDGLVFVSANLQRNRGHA